MSSENYMEYRDIKQNNHTSYNVNHFVNKSINSSQQEVITRLFCTDCNMWPLEAKAANQSQYICSKVFSKELKPKV